jgi:hypothetical protein
MAGPFGQAPTFGEYLDWLKAKTDYDYKSGLVPPRDEFIWIHDSQGNKVVCLPIPESERLAPTTISRIDRLLDVDSPFPKTPF